MEAEDDLSLDIPSLIRIHKSGRADRYLDADTVPASSFEPAAAAGESVSSKDVVIAPDTGVSARLYLPNLVGGNKKRLPLLVYFHGGAFCLGNPFMRIYHNYLTSLVAKAGIVAASVHYRLAPEHPFPAAYEDSWAALQWVAAHASGLPGADPWLADHADFGRLFLAGESAGANIAHHMAMRATSEGFASGVAVRGVVLIHPYFLGSDAVQSAAINPVMTEILEKFWEIACPAARSGVDDPWINPAVAGAPNLARLGCRRVMVSVAEEDVLRDRGRAYCRCLKESGWEGEVELNEDRGKGHAFHLAEPGCDETLALDAVICKFLNRE